jgi:Zn-dependent peptidase ImmA (M78 family)
LIDFNVNELPVRVSAIAKSTGIVVIKNSDANMLKEGESGITIVQNSKFHIIYNDTESSKRCRFTIAHELGHIFLGHLLINTPQYRTFKIQNDTESQANVFARDLLAPACVLHELQALSAADISKICNISLDSATFRAERMKELELRNAWYLHPLEREVRQQFDKFIKKKKAE